MNKFKKATVKIFPAASRHFYRAIFLADPVHQYSDLYNRVHTLLVLCLLQEGPMARMADMTSFWSRHVTPFLPPSRRFIFLGKSYQLESNSFLNSIAQWTLLPPSQIND